MILRSFLIKLILSLAGLVISCQVYSQKPVPDTTSTPSQVVEYLYDLITFGPNTPPDWNKVSEVFTKEAIIVLRTGKGKMTRFTREEFVEDFKQFATREQIVKNGFSEKILNINNTTFGDIAHLLVLYEATIPGTEFKPQQGVDSFQLIRLKSGWKIVSIVNDVVSEENPAPNEFNP